MELINIMKLASQDYQAGWNAAHHDVTVDGDWFSIYEIEERGKSQDYVEGYLASQDNLLEYRAQARLNDQSLATAGARLPKP